jgi:hypothetical protein
MLHVLLKKHTGIRDKLSHCNTYEKLQTIIDELKTLEIEQDFLGDDVEVDEKGLRKLPDYILQPYVRPAIPKASPIAITECENYQKRKNKNSTIKIKKVKLTLKVCIMCPNVSSEKCSFGLFAILY